MDDWYLFIELVESEALKHKIWEFINPGTLEAELPKLTMPKEPTYSDIKPPVADKPLTEYEDLNPGQISRFNYQLTRFLNAEKRFLVQEQALLDIRARIQASVSTDAFIHTTKCPRAYDMLSNLKVEYCPNSRQREQQLRDKYRALNTLTSTEEVEPWIHKWESVVKHCQEINLPDTQNDRPQHDFVRATRDRYPAFYTFQNGQLIRGDIVELRVLIRQFRDHLRTEEPAEPRGQHGAFSATFQGKDSNQGSKGSSDKTTKPPSKCVCGGIHFYSDCNYLNPSRRKPNWTPKEATQKRIDELLAKDERLRQTVERALAKATGSRPNLVKDQPKAQEPQESSSQSSELATALCAFYQPETAFISSTTGVRNWTLYNSFILDSGATTHICHTRDRFTNFRIASESLLAGSGTVLIEGWGDITIEVQGESSSRTITLKDTAYIPSFTANIVSLNRVNKAGVYWDQINNRLIQSGITFCRVISKNSHFLLELTELTSKESAFVAQRYTKSADPKPTQTATLQTLHQRFGHAGIEAVRHIPKAVKGIDLIDPKASLATCEVCQQAKAKRQISREPVPLPEHPYQVVAFDLIEELKVELGKYILHFYCRFSGMHHVYILLNKRQDTLVRTIKDFYAYVYQRWGCRITIFHTDGERSLGDKYNTWTAELGITTYTSAPDTQDQNGSGERSGGVIIQTSRSIQIDSRLPNKLWPEIVSAAGYLLNRTPRQDFGWITPLEKLQTHLSLPNPKPKCGHIRMYGCRAYPLLHHIPKMDKLAPRAAIGYLVGWDSTNIFRVWVPSQKRIIRSRDVTFDESIRYDPRVTEPPLLPSVVETITQIELPERELDDEDKYTFPLQFEPQNQHIRQPSDQSNKVPEKEQDLTIIVDTGILTPEGTPEPTSGASSTSANHIATILTTEDLADNASPNRENTTPSSTITRFYDTSQGVSESNILQGPRERKPRREAYLASLECPEELISYHTGFMAGVTHKGPHRTTLPPPPDTWRQLEKHPMATGFKLVAQKEFQDLEKRGTWRLIDSQNVNSPNKPLPLKWVFTYKYDTNGYLDRFKARICVRGDL